MGFHSALRRNDVKKFYLMCGIPASGKSTIANEIAAAEEDAVILSSDEIRRELYKGRKYNPKQNAETFSTMRYRLTRAFDAEKTIILESINRRPSERKKYAQRAKKRGYLTICVFCRKSYIYAIHANRARNDESKRIPDEVIKKNHDYFTPPDESEGWDEIRIMDGNRYSVEVEGQKPLKTNNVTEKYYTR